MAYTADQVDDVIRKLERDLERHLATLNSAVKRVAAERDLLSTAENARDLLVLAVKGAKEWLDTVFGGSCERIGRLRLVLDQVRFSDMHSSDPRWQQLREHVEIVEAVLRDLGTFKPWVPASAKAPARLEYRGLRRRLSPGRRVNIRPDVEGEVETFEVSPPLPLGLELAPSTGVISGILQQGVTLDEATYLVTARNAAGEVQTELVFSVAETPPTSLSYPSATSELVTGEAVSWEPELQGGGALAWSVRPDLPKGLELMASSGTISGIPFEAVESGLYEVAASNAGGKAVSSLRLQVKLAPPGAPVYRVPAEGLVVEVSEHLELKPEATSSGTLFSVSPELPRGLTIDEATGVISGVSSMRAAMAVYQVTCRNDGGEASSGLSLEVSLRPPSALCFPELVDNRLWAKAQVTLTPKVSGAPTAFTVSPDLPLGLSFDAATGVISGAPALVSESSNWTVEAGNDAGMCSAELVFSVQLAPPSSLSYPSAEKEYLLLRPLQLLPALDGEAAEFSVSPVLPPGLILDARTGEISGTPSEISDEMTFEVSACNVSGAAATTLTFAVRLPPPSALAYPGMSACKMGQDVKFEPEVTGRVAKFSVAPVLPTGLALDSTTVEAAYVVTACNEAGETSTQVTLAVAVPAPVSFSYPHSSSSYTFGDVVSMEPQLEGCMGCSFSVKPKLPEGLVLDKTCGVISGSPSSVAEETSYTLCATNPSGSVEVVITFQVNDSINEDFAAQIEAVTDIAEMLAEPSRVKAFGDWMIWMVHRAFLNDPTLTDFNFNNLHMPPPHTEARIAPKLMKALASNSHIETLSLFNTNLQKVQGYDLAESLQSNSSLLHLNIECNCLDSGAVREIALALASTPLSKLESLRVAEQKQVGNFFGRPVEEAVGQLMEKNESITKLSFECNDPHWRNIIDRALLRNNDFARRRRKRLSDDPEDEVPAEEKSLGRLLLRTPPSKVIKEDGDGQKVVLDFVATQKRMPTTSQLQSFAKNNGTPLKYSEVAPLLRDFRSSILAAAVGTEVTVADIFEADTDGRLGRWSVNNDNWSLDIWAVDGKRYDYKSSKEPALLVSDDWAAWLGAVA